MGVRPLQLGNYFGADNEYIATGRTSCGRSLHPHRGGFRLRRAPGGPARRHADPARGGPGPLRAHLRDPAPAVLRRRRVPPSPDQGHPPPSGGPPRPGPAPVPGRQGRIAPQLSGGHGGPARRPRSHPQLHDAVGHRVPRHRPRSAPAPRPPSAQGRRRTAFGLHAASPTSMATTPSSCPSWKEPAASLPDPAGVDSSVSWAGNAPPGFPLFEDTQRCRLKQASRRASHVDVSMGFVGRGWSPRSSRHITQHLRVSLAQKRRFCKLEDRIIP